MSFLAERTTQYLSLLKLALSIKPAGKISTFTELFTFTMATTLFSFIYFTFTY